MKSSAGGIVDFNRSIPPLPSIVQPHLAEALRALSDDAGTSLMLRAAPAGGTEADREAGAAWLMPRFGGTVDPRRVMLTSGTQSALFLLFEGLVGQGGLLVAEALSYGVLRPLADRAHIRLKGVAIDGDGIIPEAFEQLCREERPRALYCNPTDQNPTTATMPEARRLALADVARRHGVPIIEDDPLGRLHPGSPRAIAALAPDIAWYVMGLTKCLAHGVRVAYLVGPDEARVAAAIGTAMRLSYWYPAPLHAAIATAWIVNGAAEKIAEAIRDECDARQRLAAVSLAGHDFAAQPGGLHLWLDLPAEIDRNVLTERLKGAGVLVRPADLFAVDDVPVPNAIRLSLSSPAARSDVERGLGLVSEGLAKAAGRR